MMTHWRNCKHCRARTPHRVQLRGQRQVLVCLSCHPEQPVAQPELLFVSPAGGR